jgi:hypothetical protein
MKPRSAKAKGSRLEREWAELLRGYGIDKTAKRMPLSGAFNDSRMKADILTRLPIHFELKNQENWSPLEYYKQASGVCGEKMPIIVMSRNREQIYAFLLGSDLLNLIYYAQMGGWSNIQVFKKPQKAKRTSIEDTANFAFSKANMLHKRVK